MAEAHDASVEGRRLWVALDFSDPATVHRMAVATQPYVTAFKVGLTAFAGGGPELVRALVTTKPVFLDLKFHDIPSKVEGAVAAVAELGVAYTTVHASGGRDMIRAAVAGSDGRLSVLAVTVLTSLDDTELRRVGYERDSSGQVLRLAELALEAGAQGLVCSPREVGALRAALGETEGGPLIVVPGVRGTNDATDDQRRTLSAREAIDAGADVVVVGRPITAASDAARAARHLLEEIGA